MKNLRYFILIFLLIPCFLISGCSYGQTSSSEQLSSNESSTSIDIESTSYESSSLENDTSSIIESSSEEIKEEITTKVQSFYHKFEQANFTANGGFTSINGLDFEYSAFKYLGGSTLGVQIGSKKNPQTTLWELTTSFNEEVIITSFYVELANASGGSGTYSYSFGDYTVTKPFSTPQQLTKHGEEDLEVEATDLKFTLLSNAAAIYLYSISFTCITSIDSSLEISGDKYDAKPVVPGENSIPATKFSQTTAEEYYKNIDLTASNLYNSVIQNQNNNDKKTGVLFM